MRYFIILLAIPLTIASCKKEKLNKFDGVACSEERQSYDVNADGVADFELRCMQISTMDIPVSQSTLSAEFHELNSAYLIDHTTLFKFTKGDTIHRPTGEYQDLVKHIHVLLTRNWDGDNWDENWTAHEANNGTYYLSYVLHDGSKEDLGWMELDLDETSGTVTLINSAQTSADYLIIK